MSDKNDDSTFIKIVPDPKQEFNLDLIQQMKVTPINRTETYKGIPDCPICHGQGFVSKGKACKVCVKKTGNCNVCKNTGLIIDIPGKKCRCIWGKDR